MRAKADDPFGPDLYEETVDDKRQLASSVEAVVDCLRSGALGISANEDAVGSLGRGTGRSR